MPAPLLVVFGLGYTARRFAAHWRAQGGQILATQRAPQSDSLPLDDPRIAEALRHADAILASIPPDDHPDQPDPVLRAYATPLSRSPARWIGYLSSTGVYGDTNGAWVDETAPTGTGRTPARSKADADWRTFALTAAAPVHLFRLAGIYGPGRSALDRVQAGTAQRIDAPGHIFCRIHVDDIVSALAASCADPDPAGIAHLYNVADDEPASAATVIEAACALLNVPLPPLIPLHRAKLSPMLQDFYSQCRRVSNARLKQRFGWTPRYPSYREGLAACLHGT